MRPAVRTVRLAIAVLAATAVSLGGTQLAHGATDVISTVAGFKGGGSAGDGGPATLAQVNQPEDMARLPGGDVLIADTANNEIRRIDANGTITTFAGTGTAGNTGDGGAATAARLNAPQGVGVTPGGDVLIADTGNASVREVDVSTGTIRTVATGTFVGGGPVDVAAIGEREFLVADRPGHRVLDVDFTDNVNVSVVAGTGAAGSTGDGGAAAAATLSAPDSISLIDASGSFLVADQAANRVRRVSDGVITTVVGTGAAASTGDGGPAAAAAVNAPSGVTAIAGGGFFVAEKGGNRIRRVSAAGTISTVAGGGAATPGDGGAPTGARLSGPSDVLGTNDGFLFSEATGDRIRRVAPGAVATTGTGSGGVLPVDRPVIRRTAVVQAIRGTIRVRPKGKRRFVKLTKAALITVGSEVDAEKGVARVTVASDTKGTLSSANVRGGRFEIFQGRGAKPITGFDLSASLTGCPRARTRSVRAVFSSFAGKKKARKRGRRSRRLWVETHKKRFRTRGRYATGTVRGTRWLTTDGCRATRIQVTRGVVTVRDLTRKRTRHVPRGKSYTARARRR